MSGAGFHVHGPHDHELEHAAQDERDGFAGKLADETTGVTTYVGGGPSLMYAANAVAAFDEFARAAAAKTA